MQYYGPILLMLCWWWRYSGAITGMDQQEQSGPVELLSVEADDFREGKHAFVERTLV